MARLDGCNEIVGSIVYASNDVSIPFGVGSPENDDLVELILCLEVADVRQRLANRSNAEKENANLPNILTKVLNVIP